MTDLEQILQDVVSPNGMRASLNVKDDEIVGLLFMSNWSSSCKQFMNVLDKVCVEVSSKLHVVIIPLDKSLHEFKSYFNDKVNSRWVSIPFKHSKPQTIADMFHIHDIPAFILLSADLKVINEHGRESVIVSGSAGFPWKPQVFQELDSSCVPILEKHPAVIYFYDELKSAEDALSTLKNTAVKFAGLTEPEAHAEKLKDIRFFSAQFNSSVSRKIRDFTGLNSYPLLCIIDLPNNRKFKGYAGTEFDGEHVESFCRDFVNGRLTSFVKSETRAPSDLDVEHPGLYRCVAGNLTSLMRLPEDDLTHFKSVLIHVHSVSNLLSQDVAEQMYRLASVVSNVEQREGLVIVAQIESGKNDLDPEYFTEKFVPVVKLFQIRNQFDGTPSVTSILYQTKKSISAEDLLEFIKKQSPTLALDFDFHLAEEMLKEV